MSCTEKKTSKKTLDTKLDTEVKSQSKVSPENIDSLTNLINANPENAELYMQRAELWINKKRLIAADQDLQMAVKLDSLNDTYLLAYGNLSALINNTRKSKNLWETCVKINPENLSCRIKLSELYFFVQEYEKSVKYANEVLKMDRTKYLASFFKGMSILESGDTVRAIRNFQDAVENKPDFIRGLEMLAKIYSEKDDLLAVDYYKAMLNVNPADRTAYFNIAYFYQARKDYENSINYYALASQVDPENSGILYNLGYIHTQLNLNEKALAYFSKAIEINNVDYKSFFARGYLNEVLGNNTKAIEDYSTTLIIKPGYLPASTRLALLKK